jgi:hypothetical protein
LETVNGGTRQWTVNCKYISFMVGRVERRNFICLCVRSWIVGCRSFVEKWPVTAHIECYNMSGSEFSGQNRKVLQGCRSRHRDVHCPLRKPNLVCRVQLQNSTDTCVSTSAKFGCLGPKPIWAHTVIPLFFLICGDWFRYLGWNRTAWPKLWRFKSSKWSTPTIESACGCYFVSWTADSPLPFFFFFRKRTSLQWKYSIVLSQQG